MINNEEEYILCAAIHFDDGIKHAHQPRTINTGIVLCGWRHGCIFPQTKRTVRQRQEEWYDPNNERYEFQGFLTSKNRFVDREEAGKIAFAAGQTKTLMTTLYSEDIY